MPSTPTRVIYVPSGRYIVHDTIRLKPDTVLIGLHPSITQFDLPDNTPGFAGVGAPKALLETPARRRQYRVGHRPVHRRHQSARGGSLVAVGRNIR